MTQTQTFIAIGVLFAIGLLHALGWLALVGIGRLTGRVTEGPFGAYASAYARPIRNWLRERHPRVYRALSSRLSPRRFAGLPLTLLVVGALYMIFLFAGLAEEVMSQDAIVRFDDAFNEMLAPWRVSELVMIFTWFTQLADGTTLAAVAIVGTGYLWALKHPDFILPLWTTFLGSQLTVYVGKYLVDRPRPDFIEGAYANFASFPSGHTAGAAAVYGFTAFAIARDLPMLWQRYEVAYWSTVLILCIAFSRLFLSVHFVSDILAGLLVGGFWLLAGIVLREWSRSRMAVAGVEPRLAE